MGRCPGEPNAASTPILVQVMQLLRMLRTDMHCLLVCGTSVMHLVRSTGVRSMSVFSVVCLSSVVSPEFCVSDGVDLACEEHQEMWIARR